MERCTRIHNTILNRILNATNQCIIRVSSYHVNHLIPSGYKLRTLILKVALLVAIPIRDILPVFISPIFHDFDLFLLCFLPSVVPSALKDQTLISALLESCSDTIQPIISSADTSHEAWKRLNDSYASSSRSRKSFQGNQSSKQGNSPIFEDLVVAIVEIVLSGNIKMVIEVTIKILTVVFVKSMDMKRRNVTNLLGCMCYPWLRPYLISKFQPKSTHCIFLGYSTSKSAYKCLDPTTNYLYFSRHVKFEENIFPLRLHNKDLKFTTLVRDVSYPRPPPESDRGQVHNETYNSLPNLSTSSNSIPVSIIQPDAIPTEPFSPAFQSHEASHSQQASPTTSIEPTLPTSPSEDTRQTPSTSRPSNHVSPPHSNSNSDKNYSFSQIPTSSSNHSTHIHPSRTRKRNLKYYNEKYVNITTAHPLPTTLKPSTVTQALKDPIWRKAIDDEFNALLHNGTWELISKSTHVPIVCKWVFRIKQKPDGSIDKYRENSLKGPSSKVLVTFSPKNIFKPKESRATVH
ncbi:retrovirus-related pol polyprotein from transposon TNT 1-94 [Tanacetum coccineum]